jgi:hypothetical protein
LRKKVTAEEEKKLKDFHKALRKAERALVGAKTAVKINVMHINEAKKDLGKK